MNFVACDDTSISLGLSTVTTGGEGPCGPGLEGQREEDSVAASGLDHLSRGASEIPTENVSREK